MKICPECRRPLVYIVQPGDTLSSIAARLWPRGGPGWTELFQTNRHQLKSPNLILVGTELLLPQ